MLEGLRARLPKDKRVPKRGLVVMLLLAGLCPAAASWNLPPARIDLGDAALEVGAVASGALFGANDHQATHASGALKRRDDHTFKHLAAALRAGVKLSYGIYLVAK